MWQPVEVIGLLPRTMHYAHIINYEHDLSLPASMVDADTLVVAALSKDIQFKNADDKSSAPGVF
jgi:hypothetical protein